jgi:hypothetical protein
MSNQGRRFGSQTRTISMFRKTCIKSSVLKMGPTQRRKLRLVEERKQTSHRTNWVLAVLQQTTRYRGFFFLLATVPYLSSVVPERLSRHRPRSQAGRLQYLRLKAATNPYPDPVATVSCAKVVHNSTPSRLSSCGRAKEASGEKIKPKCHWVRSWTPCSRSSTRS